MTCTFKSHALLLLFLFPPLSFLFRLSTSSSLPFDQTMNEQFRKHCCLPKKSSITRTKKANKTKTKLLWHTPTGVVFCSCFFLFFNIIRKTVINWQIFMICQWQFVNKKRPKKWRFNQRTTTRNNQTKSQQKNLKHKNKDNENEK